MLNKINIVVWLLLVCGFSSDIAYAKVEGGITFSNEMKLEDGIELVLNGTGIRRKWFVTVYSAGLYLPKVSSETDTILSMSGSKLIRMVFLYKEVSREKLLKTLDKGFKDNHSEGELIFLADKLSQLKALFKTVKKGDEVVLSYSDSLGTQVYFNNELQGAIMGFEFNQAVLRVWLGDIPADKKLKQGLLGLNK